MNTILKTLLLVSILLLTSHASVSASPLATQAQPHTASWAIDWWLPRHKQKLFEKAQMKQVDLVFLGDSITHAWDNPAFGLPVWENTFAPLNAINLGFSGDRTEHVLWRLENGAVDNINPKLLVLMIGTNNTGHRQDKPSDTALGIKRILETLAHKLPNTKVLLLAIFPRGKMADDPLRKLNNQVNQIIAQYHDNERVFYKDINHLFLDDKNAINTSIMQDYLHPNKEQYQVWANAIAPTVMSLMDE